MKKMYGIGHSPRQTKASNVFPQPCPMVLYIGRPAKGNAAPKIARRTVEAATADAAYRVNVSTRYVLIVMKFATWPAPKNAVPTRGTAHWIYVKSVEALSGQLTDGVPCIRPSSRI